MIKSISKIIQHLAQKPRILFLVDGIGALLTAFFTVVIWINFDQYVGMPKTALSILSTMAVFLCIYSTICFCLLKENWNSFIRIICIANLLYCFLTIGLIIVNLTTLTIFGLSYFLAEITIVIVLVYIEFHVAMTIKKNKTENN